MILSDMACRPSLSVESPRRQRKFLLPWCSRHVVPRSAVQLSARPFLLHAAPLLEEERHIGCLTLVSYVHHPSGVNRASSGAGLAADDDPIDIREIEPMEGPEQLGCPIAFRRFAIRSA